MAPRRPSEDELLEKSQSELVRLRRASRKSGLDTFLAAAEARRNSVDQMMWQVPALSLTAQSFLLTIALGHDTRWVGRVLSAALGLIAAGAAIQLLLKHRYHELMYSFWLDRFEDEFELPNLHSPARAEGFAFKGQPHVWYRDSAATTALRRVPHNLRRRLVPLRSPHVWIWALTLFGIADGVVLGAWLVHVFCHRFNAFG